MKISLPDDIKLVAQLNAKLTAYRGHLAMYIASGDTWAVRDVTPKIVVLEILLKDGRVAMRDIVLPRGHGEGNHLRNAFEVISSHCEVGGQKDLSMAA
ncbi:MAG: hypothetical protein PHV99_02580 [Candidatus Pacebacteria bacterium]|nr:hypothetical protein [Candidatus Paceibacterota bacterium]